MADDFQQIADLVADALDLSGAEITNILDDAPLLQRLGFVPSSNGTTHKYITNTSNPTVGFVSETGGRDFDGSVDATVTANLSILDFSFAVRKAVADAWRSGGAEVDYIAREAARHIRAAMRVLEDQILNNTDGSNGFTGLPGLATLNGLSDAMVVNAAGTTADTASSCYLIREGDLGVQGVYKGDGPVVSLGDTITQDLLTGSGAPSPAYYTPGTAWFGMQIGGAYSVSRIANLTADAGKGLTDNLLYEAYANHPTSQRPTVCVMNRRSQEQLRASRTATNATGAPAPIENTVLEGIPVIVTDQLPTTEALVA